MGTGERRHPLRSSKHRTHRAAFSNETFPTSAKGRFRPMASVLPRDIGRHAREQTSRSSVRGGSSMLGLRCCANDVSARDDVDSRHSCFRRRTYECRSRGRTCSDARSTSQQGSIRPLLDAGDNQERRGPSLHYVRLLQSRRFARRMARRLRPNSQPLDERARWHERRQPARAVPRVRSRWLCSRERGGRRRHGRDARKLVQHRRWVAGAGHAHSATNLFPFSIAPALRAPKFC